MIGPIITYAILTKTLRNHNFMETVDFDFRYVKKYLLQNFIREFTKTVIMTELSYMKQLFFKYNKIQLKNIL